MVRISRISSMLFLLVIATSVYGDNHKQVPSSDVELSIYIMSHSRYSDIHEIGDGVQAAYVDGKTESGLAIFIDPIVIGNIEDHPGKTVIQKVGKGQLKLRVSGSVFDTLADGILGDKRNPEHISLFTKSLLGRGHVGAQIRSIPIDEQATVAPHPAQKYMDENPHLYEELRPFPYAGRFEFIPVLIDDLFDIEVSVFASGVLGDVSTSHIEIAVDNITPAGYDLEAQLKNPLYSSIHEPLLLHINDPEVTEHNIKDHKALVNGTEVGLRFIDGQLQLDRPLFATYRKPIVDFPNIVQSLPDGPGFMLIEYKGKKLRVSWGFTG